MRHTAATLAVIFLCITASAFAEARITKTDGKTIDGRIISETTDQVEVMGSDSVKLTIPRSAIRTINYNYTPPSYATGVGVLGITFGTPAGINLVVGRMWEHLGVRISGMYLGQTISGFQGDLEINLSRSENFSQNISLGGGYSRIQTTTATFYGNVPTIHDWTYFGLGYDFRVVGFFLSIGASIGSGSYTNPQLMFQIGYVRELK